MSLHQLSICKESFNKEFSTISRRPFRFPISLIQTTCKIITLDLLWLLQLKYLVLITCYSDSSKEIALRSVCIFTTYMSCMIYQKKCLSVIFPLGMAFKNRYLTGELTSLFNQPNNQCWHGNLSPSCMPRYEQTKWSQRIILPNLSNFINHQSTSLVIQTR